MNSAPAYRSLAFDDMPAPDYADMAICVLPDGATSDAAEWAASVFSIRAMPPWVRAAFAVRQALAPLIGVPRGSADAFAVHRVSGEEALIVVDDTHLAFRCAVGVDEAARLVRVTTAVTLHGRRGRFYFWPVKLAHPTVVNAMLMRSQKLLTPSRPRATAT